MLVIKLGCAIVVLIYMLGTVFSVRGQYTRDQNDIAENSARLRSLERDLSAVRADMVALNIQQRLTRIETRLDESKSAEDANRSLMHAILAGVILVVLERVFGFIAALRRRESPIVTTN